MFVGHTAVALLARRRARAVPLGAFLAATFGLDLLWPLFLLPGIETVAIAPGATAFTPLSFTSYPWSHSLLMALVWGGVAAALARSRRVATGDAVLIGAVVFSHWVLDFVTHVPDLQIAPGLPLRVGLGLWRSIPATLLIEGALYAAAIVLLLRGVRAEERPRPWPFGIFLALSAVIWASGPWSPPPPSARSLAWFAMANWLLVAWGAWAARPRIGGPISA